MPSRNTQAMRIAIIAGLLFIIAGISGLATWETIKDFVTTHIVDNSIIQIVFAILIFIASLGGIAVIIGGILIDTFDYCKNPCKKRIKFYQLMTKNNY